MAPIPSSHRKGLPVCQVTILVSGGVVQSVQSDNPQIEVELVDFDNEPDAQYEEKTYELL